jgi:hypothetical protein
MVSSWLCAEPLWIEEKTARGVETDKEGVDLLIARQSRVEQ